jgi:hypothetical protein
MRKVGLVLLALFILASFTLLALGTMLETGNSEKAPAGAGPGGKGSAARQSVDSDDHVYNLSKNRPSSETADPHRKHLCRLKENRTKTECFFLALRVCFLFLKGKLENIPLSPDTYRSPGEATASANLRLLIRERASLLDHLIHNNQRRYNPFVLIEMTQRKVLVLFGMLTNESFIALPLADKLRHLRSEDAGATEKWIKESRWYVGAGDAARKYVERILLDVALYRRIICAHLAALCDLLLHPPVRGSVTKHLSAIECLAYEKSDAYFRDLLQDYNGFLEEAQLLLGQHVSM